MKVSRSGDRELKCTISVFRGGNSGFRISIDSIKISKLSARKSKYVASKFERGGRGKRWF